MKFRLTKRPAGQTAPPTHPEVRLCVLAADRAPPGPHDKDGGQLVNTWKAHFGASAGVAMALLLPACSEHGAGETRLALTGKDYCTPFKAANAGSNATGLAAPATADPGAAFDDCVHRWSYTLAPSLDPADVVAQASVDACSSALTAMSQQTASQPSDAAPDQQNQPNAAAGPTMAQQMRMAEAKALFYVVQARAAGCAPPPANSLTTPPVG
jgi:hypothetical protein